VEIPRLVATQASFQEEELDVEQRTPWVLRFIEAVKT
jgi:hypothetical protein